MAQQRAARRAAPTKETTVADTTPAPEVTEPPAADGELCAACWPDGWPTPDTNNASCEHGTWDR
jgi:hypothetical protein